MTDQNRCPRCGHDRGRLGPGKGPHAASWLCEKCGRWLAWVSKRLLRDITDGELTGALERFSRGQPR
jgi:hypothetical protein